MGGKPCSLEVLWTDVCRSCGKSLGRACVRVFWEWAVSLHEGVVVLRGEGFVGAGGDALVSVGGLVDVYGRVFWYGGFGGVGASVERQMVVGERYGVEFGWGG